MGPKTTELINILNEIETLLQEEEDDDESHWLKLISSANRNIKNSDYSGIESLLSSYGGMGSFNDLVIGQTYNNGKFEWKENAKENNKKLEDLRSTAYELLNYIAHNH